MIMYLDIKLTLPCKELPSIDFATLKHPTQGIIILTWDECDSAFNKKGESCYRFKGIKMGTSSGTRFTYANGKQDFIKECTFESLFIHYDSEVEEEEEISILSNKEYTIINNTIEFRDGDVWFELPVEAHINL